MSALSSTLAPPAAVAPPAAGAPVAAETTCVSDEAVVAKALLALNDDSASAALGEHAESVRSGRGWTNGRSAGRLQAVAGASESEPLSTPIQNVNAYRRGRGRGLQMEGQEAELVKARNQLAELQKELNSKVEELGIIRFYSLLPLPSSTPALALSPFPNPEAQPHLPTTPPIPVQDCPRPVCVTCRHILRLGSMGFPGRLLSCRPSIVVCVCVCVYAYVRACVRACVRVCVPCVQEPLSRLGGRRSRTQLANGGQNLSSAFPLNSEIAISYTTFATQVT